MAGGRGSGARAELAGRTPGEGGRQRGGCHVTGIRQCPARVLRRPQPDPGPTARGNQRRWKEDAIRAGRTDQDEPDVCVSFAAASAVIAGRD
uniref:Uncharacterized protein n=1 Tax=Knipowitschia caucasica TaxID=637954 RepID=A0AAV2K6J0_KNICA